MSNPNMESIVKELLELKRMKEELEAEYNCYECKVEQWLFCYWSVEKAVALLDQFFGDYPDCEDRSCQEHEDACEAEEMHWLLAEPAEEPK